MNNQKRLPAKGNNRNRHSPMTIPNMHQNTLFSPKDIYYYGKKGDRNCIGCVERRVVMRNSNNETFEMTERHKFINVNKRTNVRVK